MRISRPAQRAPGLSLRVSPPARSAFWLSYCLRQEIFFRRGLFRQADLLSLQVTSLKWGPLAPSQLRDFPATMNPSDSLLGSHDSYVFPPRPAVHLAPWGMTLPYARQNVAQKGLPGSSIDLSTHAAPNLPTSGRPPESLMAAYTHCFTMSARFIRAQRLATFAWANEAKSGSLTLRLASSPFEASEHRITPAPAQLATCPNGLLTW